MSERRWQQRFTFVGRRKKDSQVRWLNTTSVCCSIDNSALAPFGPLCGRCLSISLKCPLPVAHRGHCLSCRTRKRRDRLHNPCLGGHVSTYSSSPRGSAHVCPPSFVGVPSQNLARQRPIPLPTRSTPSPKCPTAQRSHSDPNRRVHARDDACIRRLGDSNQGNGRQIHCKTTHDCRGGDQEENQGRQGSKGLFEGVP